MKQPHEILSDLISTQESLREFARMIQEDSADVIRWKNGQNKIKPRAVVSICRLFPSVRPYDLNPHHFPIDLKFVFGEQA